MNWNIPTILFHFHGDFQHKNWISKLLELAYPNVIVHKSRTLFWGYTSLEDSPTVHPFAFRHAHGLQGCTRGSGRCAPVLWEHHVQMAPRMGQAREKTEHGKERIWNDRLPFWERSQIPSSLLSLFPAVERSKVKDSLLWGCPLRYPSRL